MTFTLPSLRSMAKHATPRVLEGTVAPMALFYVGYTIAGLWGGIVAALVWSYGATVIRVIRGVPVTGLLLMSVLAVTVRAATTMATGSVFVYFLQPTLGTFVTGGAFLLSAMFRRPLTERLSQDFVDLPETVSTHPAIRRLHVWLSLLWAVVFIANGGVALWLLVSSSVGTFLVAKSVAGAVIVGGSILLSVRLFVRCVDRHAVTAPASL